MKTIGVFYATREGHTRQIADRIAADLRARGLAANAVNVRTAAPNLDGYSGVALAASVHAGAHEREMVRFVKAHLNALNRVPTAFISVTLSEAGVERAESTPQERAQCRADVQRMMEDFFKKTGWRPSLALPVAGALLYSRYNLLVRFVMKRIAKKMRAGTDTSRDYDYTDWGALDRFAGQLTREFELNSV